MPKGIQDFIRKNATPGNIALGAAFNLGDLTSADHKLRGLLNTLKDIALWPVTMKASFAGLFSGMQKSIRSLVHDTGSLEAALKKLSKIQELQKVFAPFVGGAKAAQKEVAMLVNFASSKNLKLDSVAEGAKNLQVMTRGAYAGAKALEEMNNAAEDTGNSLEEVTSATGDFYATLRDGGSIKSAAERMREMGLISQGTADRLGLLQQTGAKVQETFDELTQSMARFKGGQSGSSSANASLAGAKQGLQEAFGSPFAADDIENTKNFAAALKAITPAVAELSKFFASLIGGLGTMTSQFAKWAAESPKLVAWVKVAVEGMGALVAAVSALAAVSLAGWLVGTAAGMTLFAGATGSAAVALTALSVAIRIAMGAAGIGLAIATILTITGVTGKWTSAAEKSQKAIQDQKRANDEFNTSLQEQIASITTLVGLNEALAAARAAVAKAESEAPSVRNPSYFDDTLAAWQKNIDAGQDPDSGEMPQEWIKSSKDLTQARAALAAYQGIDPANVSKGPGMVAAQARSQEDARMLEEQGRGTNLDSLVTRAKTARQGEIDRRNVMAGYRDPLKAAETSSVYMEARAREKGLSGSMQDMWMTRAKIAREEEENAGPLEREAASGQRGARRGAYQENIGYQISGLQARGRDTRRYSNAGEAAENYERLRGIFGDNEAAKRAFRMQSNSISLQSGQANMSLNAAAAVTDMARIGGGGNVEAARAGVEDRLKEIRDLNTDMRDYLAVIAGKKDAALSLK